MEDDNIPPYHTMRLSADVLSAIALRNGMTPSEIDAAVHKLHPSIRPVYVAPEDIEGE